MEAPCGNLGPHSSPGRDKVLSTHPHTYLGLRKCVNLFRMWKAFRVRLWFFTELGSELLTSSLSCGETKAIRPRGTETRGPGHRWGNQGMQP